MTNQHTAQRSTAAYRPHHICFICEGLVDHSGGAERVLVNAAAALAAEGHRVEIVTHEREAGDPFYRLPPDVKLVPLRLAESDRGFLRREVADRARRILYRWIYRLRLYHVPPLDWLTYQHLFGAFRPRLERHLARSRPDIAVAFMPVAMGALAFCNPGYSVKKVGCTHNVPQINFGKGVGHNVNRIYWKTNNAALERLDVITVLLEEHRAGYPERLRERVRILPNAVHPEPAALGHERKKVVLGVGRLTGVKRFDLLIHAWARLADRFPDWRLEICGAGRAEEKLRKQIARYGLEDVIHLAGAVRDIKSRYLSASILAHPASYEGFPMAVCESLAAGLPVVGFEDCPGLNSLVKDDVNGVLVPAREDRISAFAEALSELLEDSAKLARLRRAASASMAPYAPEQVQRQWHKVLFDAPAAGEAQLRP